jgi:hypothetical protein
MYIGAGCCMFDIIHYPVAVKKIAFCIDTGYTVFVWKERQKGIEVNEKGKRQQ